MLLISGFYIALTALLLLALAYMVVRLRLKHKIGLLDGGEKTIAVAMRAQANALETALPVLLLLMVAELNGAYAAFLHVCGIGFLLSRVLHAWGFVQASGGMHFGRYYGTLLTWIVLLALIVRVLWLSVGGMLGGGGLALVPKKRAVFRDFGKTSDSFYGRLQPLVRFQLRKTLSSV